ncbi:MAG: FHA domain-containing protein [Myxococcaceae bacterium]
MKVRELKGLAQTLGAEKFVAQLGPFVLIQRPPREIVAQKDAEIALRSTMPSRRDRTTESALAIIHEFQNLHVAALPPMSDKDEIVLGRQPDCDVVVDEASVSKRHASFKWDDQKKRCLLKDLGSSNGTFVDEAKLGRKEQVLEDTAVLTFGDVDFWYMPSASLHWRLMHWSPQG